MVFLKAFFFSAGKFKTKAGSLSDHVQFGYSTGRLQGRRVAHEEYGPPERQCGYTLAPVF